MTKAPPSGERGFALLIVFLMAAAIALMLYQQIPRVGFESQRDKEETLIARGEQYKRGIQLYFLEFKRYPAKIEDLENTNNKRFLRRRYIDPMTGKDEWRLVHVNGAGQLTDSQVQKPPAPADEKTQLAANNPTAATGTSTDATPEVNAAVLRRPSDRPLMPAGPLSGVGNPANGVDPNDPRNWPPLALQPVGLPGSPGQQPGINTQPFPGQQYPGQQLPGQQFPGQQFPGQQFPGQAPPGLQFPGQQGGIQAGVPGQVVPIQLGGNQVPGVPPGFPGQPGNNPQNPNPNQGNFGPGGQFVPPPPPDINNPQGSTIQPVPIGLQAPGGFGPNAQGTVPNPALGMINELLRTPRAAPNAPNVTNAPLNAGGLAGVASTYTGPSIKNYRERSKYNEWEFIFDLKQGLPGQPAPAQRQPNQPNNPLGPGSPTGPPINPSQPQR